MMRFASLGSGSRGNAMVVEAGATRIMVDCGFSAAEAERRLARLGLVPDDLDAIVVTHEHGDHIGGVDRLARRYDIRVCMTPGTLDVFRGAGDCRVSTFNCHEAFSVGDLEIRPFPVPHDAREPSQFVFSDGVRCLGLLTDTGLITEHIVQCLDGCDGLVLECNHDENMLSSGPYPPSLKSRVGGRLGHLSNRQAAGLLQRIDTRVLQHLVAAHLSDKNNCPRLVRDVVSEALDCEPDWIGLACQETGFDWRQLA